MTNSLSFFFVKHVLLAGDLYGFYLAPYFLSQIVAIPFGSSYLLVSVSTERPWSRFSGTHFGLVSFR